MKIKKITEEEKINEPESEIVEITADDSSKEAEKKVDQVVDVEVSDQQITDWMPLDSNRKLKAGRTEIYREGDSLNVQNRITKALDSCLAAALRNRDIHRTKTRANIRLVGLPGSGKTASVYDWAARAIGGDRDLKVIDGKLLYRPLKDEKARKVNVVYVNMKNNDLQAWIDGYSVHVPGKRGQTEYDDSDDEDYVKQAFSHNLDSLDEPNSILFLDEYSRQKDDQIRASVLTLINEHYISGTDKGKRYFPNFLFTIACENPAVVGDRGAAEVNDAEKSRYWSTIQGLDSNPEDTVEYLEKEWLSKIKTELYSYEEPDYDAIEEFARILDLGKFLVTDSRFKYDNVDDLNEIAITKYPYKAKACNQRDLCTAIENSCGDVEKLKDWVKNQSNYLSNIDPKTNRTAGAEKTKDIILNILNSYIVPTREELFNDLEENYGIEFSDEEAKKLNLDMDQDNQSQNSSNNEQEKQEVKQDSSKSEDEIEIEDDLDAQNTIDSSKMYGGTRTVAKGQLSQNDIKSRIDALRKKISI